MRIARIVVGVDGSDDSRRALVWAAELCRELDAELLAVHSVGLLEHRDGSPGALDEWCAPIGDIPGLRWRPVLDDGPPAMVLMRVAEAEHADLIVVGTRGAGGFEELLLGSTAGHLVQHSAVPVTVVRRPSEPGSA